MEPFNKEFVKNQYGAKIVKCCASCANHQCDGREDIRICMKGRGEHYLDYYCGEDWEMSAGLNNAGKGGGKVKKAAYLRTVASHASSAHLSAALVEALREDFTRCHGSIFITR